MLSRLPRALAPAGLFAGVLLFALALLVLGIEGAGEQPYPLEASSLTAANGSAVLVYPTKELGIGSKHVEASYAFPNGPGDAYFLDCRDVEAVQRGETPSAPMLSFRGTSAGTFVVSSQTVPTRTGPALTTDPRTGQSVPCEPAIVFVWSIPGSDPSVGRPDAHVDRTLQAFDAGRYWILLAIMAGGALLALVGGLAWAGARTASERAPSPDESPLELLRASLERMGGQLERTRRHLLVAGVFGVFLWYPVLVPWTWKQAQLTSDNALFAWAVGGLTLAFLVVLTLLWGRELHRLDAELVAWRGRMRELRQREETMMETL